MERRLQSASDSIKKTAKTQRSPGVAEILDFGFWIFEQKRHETSRKIKALKELLGSPVGSRPIKFQALHF
jgi:hypothetical protein